MPWQKKSLVSASWTRYQHLQFQQKWLHGAGTNHRLLTAAIYASLLHVSHISHCCHSLKKGPVSCCVKSKPSPAALKQCWSHDSDAEVYQRNVHAMQQRHARQAESDTEYLVTTDNICSDENKRRMQKKLQSVSPVRNLKMMMMEKEVKVSAVLVPLCMVHGEPSILFTLRSSSLRKHRGEVSFPGGNKDKSDWSVHHTAMRETFEELGLNPRHFDVWGQLQPTPDRRGKSLVYPVVARYTKELDIASLKLSPDEVEEAFTCRIQDLCDLTKIGTTQFRTGAGYTLPVYLGAPHRIWGLTAIILHQVLTALAPGLYSFKIQYVS